MRSILPRLLALAWPGCGHQGAEGIVVPEPLDMSRIERGTKPNNALAGPIGKQRQDVDLITEPQPMPPAALFALAKRAIAFIPRVHRLAEYPEQLRAHYVVRSRVANFPDLVTLQVERGGWGDEALLTIWSRSIHGHYDFGANLRRLREWLAEIHIEADAAKRKT